MTSRRAIAEPSAAGAAAAAQLRGLVAGRVSTSAVSRWLYSTDASGYRVVPEAVLVAGSVDDLFCAAAVAAGHGLPLTVRGAGTSLAGQAVGPGLVVDCFKLDRIIAIDPDRRLARVEPGVIQASLNAAAAPFCLEFGPDTSTVDQATIAGMVGNNSSGSRSIVYGESKDKVHRIAAVLAGGEGLLLGPGPDDVRGPEGPRVAAALAGIGERHGSAIAGGCPRTSRCTSGYNLRELLVSAPNPARLLAGSEGTLALFAELEVELDPRPPVRVGAALTFASLRAALEANVAILKTGPSAVELLDLAPLRAAPGLSAYARLAPLLAGEEQAMLTVEYQGEEDEARENVLLPLTIAGEKPEEGWFEGLSERIGLTDRLSHRPAELSGGQQQRVAIARALVSRPTVVFADEPTGNLDSTTSHEILELMRASVDEYGQTTVMVTHDPRAAAMADRVLFLADGLIVNDIPRSSQHEILLAMEALNQQ